MKLLILPSWYPSAMDPNGVPFIRAQARSLVKHGYDVTVVFTQPYSLKTVLKRKTFMFGVRDEKKDGVREILSYFPKTHIKRIDQAVRIIMGKRRIRALFRKEGRSDLIHCHTLYAGPLALWVKKTYGLPLVTTEHYTGFARGIVKPWEFRIARRLYRHSTFNLAVSGAFASLLSERTGVTFSVLPNMVNTDLFCPSHGESSGRNAFTYLFVGSLHDKKNPLMLLESFIRIHGENPDSRLILVGEGEREGDLKRMIASAGLEGTVSLKGFLHGPQVSELMKECDCLVLPSRFETFGIVVIEAMASGLPVIVTRSGGPESFVQDRFNGLVIDQDRDELAAALRQVREISWDGNGIRQFVTDRFSEGAVISRLGEFYNACADQPLVVQGVREINLSSGISRVAYETARELTSRGIPVTTLTCERDQKECRAPIGKVIVLNCPRIFDRLPSYWGKYFRTLYFTLHTAKFYHYEKSCPHTVTIAQRDAFRADIAVGHSCHREAVAIKKKEGKRFWYLNPVHPLYLLQERRIYRKPWPLLAAISRSIGEEFSRHYGLPAENIRIIPNGVDTHVFTPEHRDRDHGDICSRLNFPPESVLVLFAGNEYHRKGLALIIEALALIPEKHVHLLVLGQDEKRDYAALADRRHVSEQVHFLGRQEGIEKFFAASVLFVLPVNYEPFGLVGIEALSCGTPVLVTEVGGFKDYVKDGANGFFIKREKKDIAEKISLLLKDRDLWEKMSLKGRETALEYSWERVGAMYEKLVCEVYDNL
ncbi:MAG: glycosyltransferase [Spirochaetales bacterium]|nr:glycosyltransferase [Spirochaetales bacterium]